MWPASCFITPGRAAVTASHRTWLYFCLSFGPPREPIQTPAEESLPSATRLQHCLLCRRAVPPQCFLARARSSRGLCRSVALCAAWGTDALCCALASRSTVKGFDACGGRSDACTESPVFGLLRTPPHVGISLDGKHAEGQRNTRGQSLRTRLCNRRFEF